jgi:hypothetical protein
MLTKEWCLRKGLQWKARSQKVRLARTWNGKPDPQGYAQHTNYTLHNTNYTFKNISSILLTAFTIKPIYI